MMPLFVGVDGSGAEFTGDFDSLFTTFPHLAEKARAFHTLPKRSVGPVGLLYVGQREMGIASRHDQHIQIIGSKDATTCHIVVILHNASGAVALSHLDGVKTEVAIKQMLHELGQMNNHATQGYSVHIFGGFQDDRHLSVDLSREIIKSLESCEEEILLENACMTNMNNCVKEGICYPIIYGVAIDIHSLDIFPAEFLHKGPDESLRSCRHSSNEPVLSIYSTGSGEIIIPPFHYEPFPHAELWLQAPDHFILQHLSTSPQQEPADFVDNVKKTIEFSVTNPKEKIFKMGRARVHKLMPNGEWDLK